MKRISVVGSSSSGKTTTARLIAEALDYPHLELDGVFHQPNWTQIPDDEFRAVAVEFAENETWVVDGNYNSLGVLDLLWARADTVVWLDPPKSVVMRRVVRRTLRRLVTHEELWNGNREPLTNIYKWDPGKNIIRWVWTRFDHVRERYEARTTDPKYAHLTIIHLRTPTEVTTFLSTLQAKTDSWREATSPLQGVRENFVLLGGLRACEPSSTSHLQGGPV